MEISSLWASLFAVRIPAGMWVPRNQPLSITVQSEGPVQLVLTDFTGRNQEARASTAAKPGEKVDLRQLFPTVSSPGTYVLWAVPEGRKLPEFVGTPIVLSVRADKRPGGPNPNEVWTTRLEPLRYGIITTDKGPITCVFYYDVAPNTVSAIQTLAAEGYYDGLSFHRVVPGFVIQGGDPLGDGRGGPGFNLNAEFSSRKHETGTLSMARQGDPLEGQGFAPRPEYANSAGSQFFICVAPAASLDNKYTVFGKVTAGMEAVNQIVQAPRTGEKPSSPQLIQRFEIKPVKPGSNPYAAVMTLNP